MVIRYSAYANNTHAYKDAKGAFVKYEDYAELESEHKAALLTISQITDIVRSSDTLSISQQVAELVEANK